MPFFTPPYRPRNVFPQAPRDPFGLFESNKSPALGTTVPNICNLDPEPAGGRQDELCRTGIFTSG